MGWLGTRFQDPPSSCANIPRWERARACPGLDPGVRVTPSTLTVGAGFNLPCGNPLPLMSKGELKGF